jgi:hypothetical protein
MVLEDHGLIGLHSPGADVHDVDVIEDQQIVRRGLLRVQE